MNSLHLGNGLHRVADASSPHESHQYPGCNPGQFTPVQCSSVPSMQDSYQFQNEQRTRELNQNHVRPNLQADQNIPSTSHNVAEQRGHLQDCMLPCSGTDGNLEFRILYENYNPGLTGADNLFYVYNNQVLFNAHKSRQQRRRECL